MQSLSWQGTRVDWGLCSDKSNQSSQSTPKDQRHRGIPSTLVAEFSKMQRRPAAGRPRRGEHVLGEHRHGEHVEGTAQTTQVSVSQRRRPDLLSNHPQGEHPLRKTVAASNTALVKACHSEQVMLADHTDTFTTNSGATRKALYRDALHPSPKGTVRLAFKVKYVGQLRPPLRPPNRPSHPSPSASGRVPLLATPSFQPHVDCPPSQHLREYRNGPAVSTTRGPFSPPPLLQQRPADTESSILQRRPGDTPLHHQPHRYSRGTPQHRDVGTAPSPFSGWYRAHRHPLRM